MNQPPRNPKHIINIDNASTGYGPLFLLGLYFLIYGAVMLVFRCLGF